MESSEEVLGAHIKAGTVWLALLSEDGQLVDDRVDRLVLHDDTLPAMRALSEHEESLEELLNRLRPASMALLKAGSGLNSPAQSDSLRRGWLEGTVMLSCYRTATNLELVTHDAVKKMIGTRPSDRSFSAIATTRLGSSTPNRWTERAPAYGAGAVALAKRTGS
jgi:hypothetical protein